MNPAIICALICSVLLTPSADGKDAKSSLGQKAPTSMEELDNQKRLRPEYVVNIRIIEDRREELHQIITATGEVQVPYLGLTKAEDLTCRELAYKIKTGLEKEYFKVATVLITCNFKPFEPYHIPESKSASSLKMPASMAELDRLKPIEIGHVITIRVVEDKRAALQQVVSVTGMIQAPYLGALNAEGLTCREVADNIKAGLEKDFFRTATVLVLDCGEHVPSECALEFAVVFGAVTKEGKYDLSQQDTTVSNLLNQTGGYNGKRTPPRIYIIRKTPQGNKRLLVNTRAVFVEKRPEYDLFLRPDDFVIVE
ncbi:MAG: polysaccharide biosynthesis/export family protein [Prosthecobacter sp.]|nr:polysaccharide biosynthesis/export family protein [Prosthecobacter sp.]